MDNTCAIPPSFYAAHSRCNPWLATPQTVKAFIRSQLPDVLQKVRTAPAITLQVLPRLLVGFLVSSKTLSGKERPLQCFFSGAQFGFVARSLSSSQYKDLKGPTGN